MKKHIQAAVCDVKSADVAQLVEQLTCNQLVGGSSPSIGSQQIGCDFRTVLYWGRAGVGEPGQTVNLVSLTEWVRIQSPPPIHTR